MERTMTFFSSGLMALEYRWSKCITLEGNYIENEAEIGRLFIDSPSYMIKRNWFIGQLRCVCFYSFLLLFLSSSFHFKEIYPLSSFANSVDPDRTPQQASSDLGLQCLRISHL